MQKLHIAPKLILREEFKESFILNGIETDRIRKHVQIC